MEGQDFQKVVAMANLFVNSQTQNDTGHSAGAIMFGRAPRLPMNTRDTVFWPDYASTSAPEMQIGHYLGTLHYFRQNWAKRDNIRAIKKATSAKPRRDKTQELFVGQTVFYFHADPQTKRARWRGPAFIGGMWGNKALIFHGSGVYQIATEDLQSTQKALELLGG